MPETDLSSPALIEKIARSETRIFKAVFPNTTNHYDTLFGGTTLLMMDEVAFITATRFSRLKMVTVSSERVDFTHPIPGGTLVELIGKVIRVGSTSQQVRVELFVEQMYSDEREKAVTGLFTFVAIDQDKNPVKILP
ncbi:MAG TPA: acyl-CoA thioesterase [Hymenobacter sp.]|jgi:acyl-CoA hydrolase